MPHCLAGPAVTSTTTDATGSFTLPLDPGTYQFEYDPPAGSPLPRMIEPVDDHDGRRVSHRRRPPAHARPRGGRRPQGADGEIPLPDATVRIFEPRRCPTTDPCAPWLRAETQTDANGHFRAIVAQPGTN